MILTFFSILGVFFSILNLSINSKSKFWEITTIIPTQFEILVLLILLCFSILANNFISFIFFLISACLLIPFLDFSFKTLFKKKDSNQNSISVINMNTLFFYPSNSKDLVDYLQNQNADLILLQELYTLESQNINKISKQHTFPLTRATGYLKNDDIKLAFNKYKFVFTSYDKAIISNSPIKIIKEVMEGVFGYTIAQINLNNKDIIIINVHMPFKLNASFGYEVRKRAFEKLYADIHFFEEKNLNFILTGDFNTTTSSNFIRNLYKICLEAIHENHFGLNISWHANSFPIWRLDFMFYNKSKVFYCSSAKLIRTKYSDHKLLKAEYTIK